MVSKRRAKKGLQRRRLLGGREAGELGLEVSVELRGFVGGQSISHLREDGAVEPELAWVPGHLCRCAGFGENQEELCANFVGIGAIDWRWVILGEIVVALLFEKVTLAGFSAHARGSARFRAAL